MIYQIRMLVQYKIEAETFVEALQKAGQAVMGNNNLDAQSGQWQYMPSNEKRYVLNGAELVEVATFGASVSALTVIEPK